MNYLIDTNVVSEWMKPTADHRVIYWLAEAEEDRLHLSVATIAEIRFGIEALPGGRRRQSLTAWLAHDLVERFDSRILGLDQSIAHCWGVMKGRARQLGRCLGDMNGWIAATAQVHHLTLVTRNLKNFANLGVELLDPTA